MDAKMTSIHEWAEEHRCRKADIEGQEYDQDQASQPVYRQINVIHALPAERVLAMMMQVLLASEQKRGNVEA